MDIIISFNPSRYSLVSFWAPNYDYVLPDSADRRILAGEYYLRRNGFVKC